MTTQIAAQDQIIYPERDGQPMSDNTKQFRWIVTIQGGLDSLISGNPEVFVAGDLLWYPVEGDNKTRIAPDAMVVFGRPKGDRGSYLQWREGNIPPQVVFEVLSPGNRFGEMLKKLKFYERYGVEEYYIYDPDKEDFSAWLRSGDELQEIEQLSGFVSPRLGIRFEPKPTGLEIYRPDGQKFATYVELDEQRANAIALATQQAQRADRLAAKLLELGIDLDTL
ncbi:Uma2 family endonuclease [Synechocystis sp. PCC 7509]|uniref:Uma2 family endonuclease n=1 Tax=Synechocystis sp. PCC 7509 TaxID=927677 RepID=UPI0002AC0623|nr:Uma2 family endonuclease [Synechocystis sp. PCC 7509]